MHLSLSAALSLRAVSQSVGGRSRGCYGVLLSPRRASGVRLLELYDDVGRNTAAI